MFKKNILGICDVAAKNSTRPALSCINITKEHVTATDAYKLIRFTPRTPDTINIDDFPAVDKVEPLKEINGEINISASEFKKHIKFFGKSILPILSYGILANESKGYVSFVTTDLETTREVKFRKHDVEFPNAKKFLDEAMEEKIQSNSKLKLEQLRDLCDALIKLGFESCYVETRGENKPIVLKAEETEAGNAVGIVMPLKFDLNNQSA